MSFHVGQLVACVDASPPSESFRKEGYVPILRRGDVYEIEFIGSYLDDPFVVVVGAYSKHSTRGWQPSRFRPVTKRNTEIIAQLLQPVPDLERV
jgi:hypothetical protein